MSDDSSQDQPPAKAKKSRLSRKYKFNPSWENEFLVAMNGEKGLVCLLCVPTKSLYMKRLNVRRHYVETHSSYDVITGTARQALVSNLKGLAGIDTSKEIAKATAQIEASYVVAKTLIEHTKPFADGELVKDLLLTCSKIVSPETTDSFAGIALSRRTIARRGLDLADDITTQLKSLAQNFVAFSIAIDESTDLSDTAQLAIFVRGVDSSLNITDEYLGLEHLKGTTKRADIFAAVEHTLKKFDLPWVKLVSIATDGASAMTGTGIGFIGRVYKHFRETKIEKLPIAIRCIVHQEALSAKSVSIKSVMDVAVKVVNRIKSRALTHREFRDFLQKNMAEFGDLVYFCEVRWLSRGNMLKRFFNLRDDIRMFMDSKGEHIPELGDKKWVQDLAFLTDVTGILNDLNTELQGKKKYIIQLWDSVKVFLSKIKLLKTNLDNSNLFHFPCLSSVSDETESNYSHYANLLTGLIAEFEVHRFNDLRKLDRDFSLFRDPYAVPVEDVKPEFQMEVIQLQGDSVLKDQVGGLKGQELYLKLDGERFPTLRQFAAEILAMYGSTYVCEQFFSVMTLTKSRLRSSLTDKSLESCLRVSMANTVKANIKAIVARTVDSSESEDE